MKNQKYSYWMKTFILVSIALFSIPNLKGVSECADYPSKAIKLMVPFPPGGGTDTAARAIANSMEKDLKVPVVCENMAGGGGSIGWQWLSRQKPDGYTVGIAAASMIIQQYAGGSGKEVKNFEFISMIAQSD